MKNKNKNIQAVVVIIIFLVLIATVGILLGLNIKRNSDVANVNTNNQVQQDTNTDNEQNKTDINNNTNNESNSEQENKDESKNNEEANIEKVTGEIQKINNLLIQQIERDYNNKNLSGVEVMSAVRQYISSTQVTTILMKADNKTILATAGAKKVSGNVVSFKNNMFEITKENLLLEGGSYHHDSVSDFNNRNSEAYIDYSKTYKSYLLRLTETQDLVGIVFVENN